MVIVLLAHVAVTPAGKPLTVPIPVAPVVVCVMLVLGEAFKAVLIQRLRVALVGLTVIFAVTMILPVAFTVPQPPVNGTL